MVKVLLVPLPLRLISARFVLDRVAVTVTLVMASSASVTVRLIVFVPLSSLMVFDEAMEMTGAPLTGVAMIVTETFVEPLVPPKLVPPLSVNCTETTFVPATFVAV